MLKYQIFGSQSSRDYDVLVFVDRLGTIQENHELITILDRELAILLPDKPVNANIGILEDGMITKVFKGYPFEVNNSMYYTYDNHKQSIENQITRTYELTTEIKHLKLKRCLRFIISFYSRVPEWREEIKNAMRGDFAMRLECVRKIDLTKHREFPHKKDSITDIYKTFAFQLAQTIMLYYGREVYSKEESARYYTILGPFLFRREFEEEDLKNMNSLLKSLVMICDTELPKMTNLKEEIV